jgi:hypothetical protein
MVRVSKLTAVGPVLVLLLSLLGCGPQFAGEIRPIQQVYADRLSQLEIGMSLAEFRGIFPEAYPGGQKGTTTAYHLESKQVIRDRRRKLDQAFGVYTPQNVVSEQSLWFYFYDDRLAQWGRPNDWPERPDLIIENRSR